jgi:hypothetical protein
MFGVPIQGRIFIRKVVPKTRHIWANIKRKICPFLPKMSWSQIGGPHTRPKWATAKYKQAKHLYDVMGIFFLLYIFLLFFSNETKWNNVGTYNKVYSKASVRINILFHTEQPERPTMCSTVYVFFSVFPLLFACLRLFSLNNITNHNRCRGIRSAELRLEHFPCRTTFATQAEYIQTVFGCGVRRWSVSQSLSTLYSL